MELDFRENPSELFGHVKGALTGVIRDKVGVIQAAPVGTLLLDDAGRMTPVLQLRLLPVLQEREIRLVGHKRPNGVDVRLITATNKDLKRLLASGAQIVDVRDPADYEGAHVVDGLNIGLGGKFAT